jgi:hypothetical protein
LNVSGATLDDVGGLCERYSSKILGPAKTKRLGAMSMAPFLGALGLALIVVEDEEALARLAHRLDKRHSRRGTRASRGR